MTTVKPSLRAKRSNPSCRNERMDCFVACAPRNDDQNSGSTRREGNPVRSHRQGRRHHRLQPRHRPFLGRAVGKTRRQGGDFQPQGRRLPGSRRGHPQIRRRRPCHSLQHLAPRRGRGADQGRDDALRQDRHPGLQRRGQSLLRPAARHQGRRLRQDHELQRQEQHLAVPAFDPADGRARQRLGGDRLLDRRLARFHRDRRLRNFQGGGFCAVPQPRRRMGPEGRARQLRRAGPGQDRFCQSAVGRRGAAETPLRHHAACAASASPTKSPAPWPISAPTLRAS